MPRMGVQQYHQVIRKTCVLNVGVFSASRGSDRLLQQQRVLNVVKVSAEIDVDDSSLLLDDCVCHAVHRFMCSSFGSISIRSRLKVSFEDRFQNELKSSLDHTVTN